MSNSGNNPHSLNGCSIEESYTNLFALTEFIGIKYQKYVIRKGIEVTNDLEDPVLTSYARCQNDGLLCAWTRSKKDGGNSSKPWIFSNYAKELWIFWYEHREFDEQNRIHPDLVKDDNGDWRSGLFYEIRTILFKALHNLIEKCLLNKGFVRVGKWFIQPSHYGSCNDGPQLGTSFSFFLHGESTVCASLDLKPLPVIHSLNNRHLDYCKQQKRRLPVILCPYGLCAELIGPSVKECTPEYVETELKAWACYYPLKFATNETLSSQQAFDSSFLSTPNKHMRGTGLGMNSSAPPPYLTSYCEPLHHSKEKFVDVLIGGHRMRYPSCFVLVCEEDLDTSIFESTPDATSNSYTQQQPTAPPCEMNNLTTEDTFMPRHISMFGPVVSGGKSSYGGEFGSFKKPLFNRSLRNRQILLCQGPNFTLVKPPLTVELPSEIQRCYLADRTLKRSLRTISWLPSPSLKSDELPPEHPVQRSSFFSAAFSVPSKHAGCFCMRLSTPNRHELLLKAHTEPYHKRRANFTRETGLTLKKTFDDIDMNCNECTRSNKQSLMGGSSLAPFYPGPDDPSMPTLSPQQPFHGKEQPGSHPISQASSVGWTTSNPSMVTANAQTVPAQRPPKAATPNVTAPDLALQSVTVKEETSNVPMKHSDPSTGRAEKRHLPMGITTKLKTATRPEEKCEPFQSETKRRADVTHSTWLLSQLKDSLVEEEPAEENATAGSNLVLSALDQHESEEMAADFGGTAYGSLEVDEEPDGGSVASPTLLRSANLQRLGMSLSSSSGSGHLGPAELALMLPTPPSMEANISEASPSVGAVNGHQTDDEPTNAPTSPMALARSTLKHIAHLPPVEHLDVLTKTDWSFLHPRTVYDGLSGSFRSSGMEMNAILNAPRKIGGPVSFGFDHVLHAAMLREHKAELVFQSRQQQQQQQQQQTQEALATAQKTLPHCSPNLPVSIDHQRGHGLGCSTIMSHLNVVAVTHADDNTRKKFLRVVLAAIDDDSRSNSKLLSAVQQVVTTVNLCRLDPDTINSFDEVDGLKLNVMLQESLVNMFKDHNFDSCNICECTTSVGGREAGIYLPQTQDHTNSQEGKPAPTAPDTVGDPALRYDDAFNSSAHADQCKCGFSAVINQRYAHNANLFYEDEVEITSINIVSAVAEDPELHYALRNSIVNGLLVAPYSSPLGSTSMVPIVNDVRRSLSTYVLPPVPAINSSLHAIEGLTPRLDYLNCLLKWSRGPSAELSGRLLQDWLHFDRFAGPFRMHENLMEFKEICALMIANVNYCRIRGSQPPRLDERSQQNGVIVHPAFVMKSTSPLCGNYSEQILLLDTIRPFLQEAISSTRQLESSYTVDGPLTWRSFHQLAGRGTEESCKPQPVPQLQLLSSERQAVLISPFAIRDWDTLALHPISHKKRLAYAVVCPHDRFYQQQQLQSLGGLAKPGLDVREGQFLRSRMNDFFVELSCVFEACQLGLHHPYHPDGPYIPVQLDAKVQQVITMSDRQYLQRLLMSQPRTTDTKTDELISFALAYLSQARQATIQALRDRGVHGLDGQRLTQLFPNDSSTRKVFSSSRSSPQNGQGPMSTALDCSQFGSEADTQLVIYLVEPFTFLCDFGPTLSRLLMQCIVFKGLFAIRDALPPAWRKRLHFQVVPLSEIAPLNSEYLHRMNGIALSLYNQVDRFVQPSLMNANRTLTGFGPAADREVISLEQDHKHARFMYSPPYYLHKVRDFWDQWRGSASSAPLDRSRVLFVSYCLSEDQQYCFASCTDETGTLVEQSVISLQISQHLAVDYARCFKEPGVANASPKLSMRRIALARLWDFILNVVAKTCSSWRLVVGRLGRLGHGELRGWNGLLSRSHLQEVNFSFHRNCMMCKLASKAQSSAGGREGEENLAAAKSTLTMTVNGLRANSCTHQLPSLISACLVSLEPQSTFKVFSDRNGLSVHTSVLRGNRNGHNPHVAISSSKLSSANNTGGGQGAGSNSNSSSNQVNSGSLNLPPPLNVQGVRMGEVVGRGPMHLPSTTHILVFPTSSSASEVIDQDVDIGEGGQFDLDEFMLDMTHMEDMNYYPSADFDSMGGTGPTPTRAPHPPGSAGPRQSTGAADPMFNFQKQAAQRPGRFSNERMDTGPGGGGGGGGIPAPSDQLAVAPGEDGTHAVTTLPRLLAEASNRLFGEAGQTLPFGVADPQLAASSLMQQPIAMGYYVSSAPADTLPRWFWNPCPQARYHTPVCLKSALHLKCSLVGPDESAGTGLSHAPVGGHGEMQGHALDSSLTCDVLRYVLETYNSLSWLSMDPVLNDRASCLPLHIYNLTKMSHIVQHYS